VRVYSQQVYGIPPEQVVGHGRRQKVRLSVALPVSQTGFARDNGRTLGNVDSIRDQAASGVLAGTLVITFSAPPKTAPQVAAVAFVIPDHLVDAFMAQLDALFVICSGDRRSWRNFASILQRINAVSLRALLRIAWRA